MLSPLQKNIEATLQQPLSGVACDFLEEMVFEKTFYKKQRLAEEGKVCRYIYLVTSGSCYSYISDEKGNDHVIQFAIDGYWISDLYSFFTGQKALYTIAALETTRVLALNKENFQRVCDQFPLFDRFFRILIQNAYISLQYRLAKTNSVEAEKRYHEFAARHPEMLQKIPQYLIASYLGIKPQSLSRIRSQASHKPGK